MCSNFVCLYVYQLSWVGSVVPWYDQVHAVWGIWVQSPSVPSRTGGAFPFQLLSGQPSPPRGRVHPWQVGFINTTSLLQYDHYTCIWLFYDLFLLLLHVISFLPLRFANIEIKSVKFEDSLFENCYFEDVKSTNTFFENCTIKNTVFYNTGTS